MTAFLLERLAPAQDRLHHLDCDKVSSSSVAEIEEDIASRLLNAGHCHSCEYCEPVPDPPSLNTRGAAA